jgi:phenylpropionate dioxygenase-like ring-hydroxylating dioxygenase large terminal subunit
MFEGADLGNRGLRPLPVAEQYGLIVLGLDREVDLNGFLDSAGASLSTYPFATYQHAESRRFDLATNWKLGVDVNFEGYHFPHLHKNTLDPLVTNNSVFTTFGRHCRWAFPFRDLAEKYRDTPSSGWPDRFHGTVVYGLFPSCVLVESLGGTQMLRVYPGDRPGACTILLTQGSTRPISTDEEREHHAFAMEAACGVLRDEDFPAAEACQRGLEAGVEHILFGRNEPLLHHLAATWEQALNDPQRGVTGGGWRPS